MNDVAQLFYVTLGCELFLGGLWLLCNFADRAHSARLAADFAASARIASRWAASPEKAPA